MSTRPAAAATIPAISSWPSGRTAPPRMRNPPTSVSNSSMRGDRASAGWAASFITRSGFRVGRSREVATEIGVGQLLHDRAGGADVVDGAVVHHGRVVGDRDDGAGELLDDEHGDPLARDLRN